MSNKNNKGALGDIKYSILSEMLFQKINGDGWILADGRPINGSDLHELTSMEKAPDARGLFMRALNCNKTDAKDVERTVGSFQNDGTRLPRENPFTGVTSTNGNHSHEYEVGNAVQGHHYKTKGGEFWQKHGQMPKHRTLLSGNHNHNVSINNGGDSETRPKNMAFYVYIKINN